MELKMINPSLRRVLLFELISINIMIYLFFVLHKYALSTFFYIRNVLVY